MSAIARPLATHREWNQTEMLKCLYPSKKCIHWNLLRLAKLINNHQCTYSLYMFWTGRTSSLFGCKDALDFASPSCIFIRIITSMKDRTSPLCAKKTSIHYNLDSGSQSRSYSAPTTSREHLLEVGLLIAISVRVNKNYERILNFNIEFHLQYSVGLKIQYWIMKCLLKIYSQLQYTNHFLFHS